MGKRKSITWDHYISSFRDKIEFGTCKYCSTVFRKNATRMTQHLLYKCVEVPDDAKKELEESFPHIPRRDYRSEYYPWPDVETKKELMEAEIEKGHDESDYYQDDADVGPVVDLCNDGNSDMGDFDGGESLPQPATSSSGRPLKKRKRSSSPSGSEASESSSCIRSTPRVPAIKIRPLRPSLKASAARAALQSFSRKLTPMLDRVIVQKAEAVTKTRGGIVIPEKAQGKVLEGTIIAVGPGARNDRGEHVPVGVTVGDTVILPEYGGTKVEIDEKELFIYREHDILAKVDKQ